MPQAQLLVVRSLSRSNRAILVCAACALFALWVFPAVHVTYTCWIDSQQYPLKAMTTRASGLGELGRYRAFPQIDKEIQGLAPRYNVYWIEREVSLDWTAQALQSVLLIGATAGVMWIFGGRVTQG